MQTERNCVLVGLWGENFKGGRKCSLQEIVYWWDCGARIVRGRKVLTARNCVLVGLWWENCKGGGKCRLLEIVYWWNCGGRIVRGEGSAGCRSLVMGKYVIVQLLLWLLFACIQLNLLKTAEEEKNFIFIWLRKATFILLIE